MMGQCCTHTPRRTAWPKPSLKPLLAVTALLALTALPVSNGATASPPSGAKAWGASAKRGSSTLTLASQVGQQSATADPPSQTLT